MWWRCPSPGEALTRVRAGHSLVAHAGGGVDLLDQGVVVAAHSSTHLVLALRGAVVLTVLHHKVDRSPSVQVLTQIPKIVQNIRVLQEKGSGADVTKRWIRSWKDQV